MKDWRLEKSFPEVPETVHQTVMATLEQLEEKSKTGKPVKKTKWIILAAALIASFGMTVAAAELFKWNPKVKETFGEPMEEVQNKLTMDGVAEEQKISVTDNGITVTAIQTMNDENVFYALLQVTAEEEIIDGSGYFGNPSPELLTQNPGAFVNISMGFTDETQIGKPEKQGYYEVYALKGETGEWNEESVTISLENYSYDVFDKPGEKITDFTDCTQEKVEGKWELTLPLSEVQTENTVKTKEPVQVVVKGIPVTIEEVTLTPLAVKISYRLSDVEKLHETVYGGAEDITMSELFISGLADKSGKEISCGFTAASSMRTQDGKDIRLMGLSSAVDVHEVQAVLLGEEKVRVELP